MADIELVIKVSESRYRLLQKQASTNLGREKLDEFAEVVLNGTPLPKGHGRLIDVNDLDVTIVTTDDYSGNDVLDVVLKDDIDDAQTIIEADKEKE